MAEVFRFAVERDRGEFWRHRHSRGVAGGSIARRDDAGRARREVGGRSAVDRGVHERSARVAVRDRARGFLGFGASTTSGVGNRERGRD